ncbi:MAG TPA: Mur ligase family protein [Candidatus Paceibacterota bacterium]|nr:Mur ligase family protein [Candidatus Paceibacterota bacterium]
MRKNVKKSLAMILRAESELVLWKYRPKIIAITGSVGKTSTKDAVYSALKEIAYVRKSEKSYNSELGLPLTILGLPNGWNSPTIWAKNILKGLWLFLWPHKYPEWLVLEVGVGKPGDMKTTASWLQTDAVIMTAIGDTPVHIEFYNSRKDLIEEKSGLIDTLRFGGLLVLNADDEAILGMKEKTKNRIVTYGFSDDVQVQASGENVFYDEAGKPKGVIFRVDEGGMSIPVIIEGVFGRNHIYASLATLALASGMKWKMLEAAQALKNHDVPPGRMRLLDGINGSLIIDDTYNSSPFASEAAIKTLGGVKAMRKIAVLGDMLELGKHTEEAHKTVGKLSAENSDMLVVVGPRAEKIREGAIEAGMPIEKIFQFSNSVEAGEFLKQNVGAGDLVLLKGSQGMRMERAVEAILLDQKNKSELLVRQDKEWLEKK